MADLTYNICSEVITFEGSYANLVSSLNDIGAEKYLYIEADPSTDPTILTNSYSDTNYSTG